MARRLAASSFYVEFFRGENAVSPIIGIIIMVAITIILSGTAFVVMNGLTDQPQNSSAYAIVHAEVDSTPGSKAILIRHVSGDPVKPNEWKVSITPGRNSAVSYTSPCNDPLDPGDRVRAQTKDTAGGTATCTDAAVFNTGGTAIAPGSYHVVFVLLAGDVVLLDTNVDVL